MRSNVQIFKSHTITSLGLSYPIKRKRKRKKTLFEEKKESNDLYINIVEVICYYKATIREGEMKKPQLKKIMGRNQIAEVITMTTNSSSVRFTLNFAAKAIVGTKASFAKASKGFGDVYDELAALMAKHPDYGFEVKAPKKPAKPKQTYAGMDVKFMLDYASAVGEASFRADMEAVRVFAKSAGKSVYPLVKRMFMEHYAPAADTRFAYNAAKAIVSKYRYEGIITTATTHTVPATDIGEAENLAEVA